MNRRVRSEMLPEKFRLGEVLALVTAVTTAVWFGGVKLGDIEGKMETIQGSVENNKGAIEKLEKQVRTDQRHVLDAIEATRLESKQDRQLIIEAIDRLESRVREMEAKPKDG